MKRSVFVGAFLVVAGAITVHSATISGVVSDSANKPIKGIAIALKATASNSRAIAKDTTDSLGAYLVTCDSTGKFVLKATDPAAVYAARYDTLALDGKDITANMTLAKEMRYTVSGMVSDSATGKAIEGAVVKLGNNRRDTTKADGKYSFDNVAAGSATLSVTAKGHASKSQSVNVSNTAVTADFKLAAVITGSVSGVVTDSATGKAITGAVVKLGSSLSDTTEANGKYFFSDLKLGSYALAVSAARYVSKTDSIVIKDTVAIAVNVVLAAKITFTVSGKITDSISGAPVTGISVMLRSGTGLTLDSTGTDTSGYYSFNAAFDGSRIKVVAMGYDTVKVTLSGTTSAAQTVNIKLVKSKGSQGLAKKGSFATRAISFQAGRLALTGTSAGTLRLMDLRGRMICVKSFSAGEPVAMELRTMLPAGSYILKMAQNNTVISKRLSF
jgi:hypothetical protein